MEPVKFQLKTPVKISDAVPEIKELVFERRPIAGDFKGLPEELSQDDKMLMLSRLTNVELVAIEKLDGHDYMRACGVLHVFLGAGPATGKESSGK